MDLELYKKDPCGMLSIPYYKAVNMTVPDGVTVVHGRDFDPKTAAGKRDEPYFRLIHRLEQVEACECVGFSVRTAGEEDIPVIADIIACSYEDFGISEAGLFALRKRPEFDPGLWVLVCEIGSGAAAACGTAEYDVRSGEGSLEWIQTLPEYRGRGLGRLVVTELLKRLKGRAEFVTVSGRAKGAGVPERLYRSCGFTGNDIWHVLTDA